MAHKFYLNDCLPEQCQQGDIYVKFEALVRSFKDLHSKKELDIDQYWTLADYWSNLTICGVQMKEIVKCTRNRDLKSYTMQLLSRSQPVYFIEESLSECQEIKNNSQFNHRPAHNLLVACLSGMLSASVSAEQELAVNKLAIELDDDSGNKTIRHIDNLHDGNQEHIKDILTPPLPAADQPLERLISFFSNKGKEIHFSMEFNNKWETLGLTNQQYIVSKFQDAYNEGLLFPAKHDTGKQFPLVKKNQADNSSSVHELRTKSGMRIYFECDFSTLFIGLYNMKGRYSGDDQSADFRRAETIIEIMKHNQGLAF